MSFLDNTKNVGTAFWIVGIVEIILGLVAIVCGVCKINDIDLATGLISGIGTIIVGFVYFGFGKDIRNGVVSEKWDIVCRFVMVTATATAIDGIFGYDSNLGNWAASAVIGIILALILVFIYKKMTDGKATTFDKIIWIILVIVMILSLLINIVSLVSFPIGTVMGICGIVISLFMLVALFDNDVKSKMGM